MTATATRTPLVEMRDIHVSFGGLRAVNGVTITLYPGEVVSPSPCTRAKWLLSSAVTAPASQH
ncbi:MAG: hypothetical protein RLZ40_500 [Actinomycetota bacterium]